jgi:hypothetical protein
VIGTALKLLLPPSAPLTKIFAVPLANRESADAILMLFGDADAILICPCDLTSCAVPCCSELFPFCMSAPFGGDFRLCARYDFCLEIGENVAASPATLPSPQLIGSGNCEIGEFALLSRRPSIPGLVSGELPAIPEKGDEGDTDRGLVVTGEDAPDERGESSLSGEDIEEFDSVDNLTRLFGGSGGLELVFASAVVIVLAEAADDEGGDDFTAFGSENSSSIPIVIDTCWSILVLDRNSAYKCLGLQ